MRFCSPLHRTGDHRECDRGSILLVTLIVIVIGASTMFSLTSLNGAIVMSQKSRDDRFAIELEADSALSFVSSRIRSIASGSSGACPTPPSDIGDVDVRVDCSSVGAPSSSSPVGFIATLHSSTVAGQTLPPWAGDIAQAIDGTLVINTGTSTAPGVSYLADRGVLNGGSTMPAWQSLSTPWSTFAASDDISSPQSYPTLPPVPTFERPGSQVRIGACNVYYPGRYLGTTSLTLNGGDHYFASGVYYFERSLTISNGARVVMGSGPRAGCTNDLDAVLDPSAPRRHAIDASGASLLFGSAARLIVQESALSINARGDAASVRTVGFGTSTTTISIPPDSVRLTDGTLIAASNHTVVPPESSTPVAYKASTLTPTTSFALDVRLNGTNPQTNRIAIDGPIFIPHAGLRLMSTTAQYSISLTGGIAAARLSTSLPLPPADPATDFSLGFEPAPSNHIVSIEVQLTRGSRSATSVATFETGEPWRLVGRSRSLLRVPRN